MWKVDHRNLGVIGGERQSFHSIAGITQLSSQRLPLSGQTGWKINLKLIKNKKSTPPNLRTNAISISWKSPNANQNTLLSGQDCTSAHLSFTWELLVLLLMFRKKIKQNKRHTAFFSLLFPILWMLLLYPLIPWATTPRSAYILSEMHIAVKMAIKYQSKAVVNWSVVIVGRKLQWKCNT